MNSDKAFKIHLYKLFTGRDSRNLVDVIRETVGIDLEDRTRRLPRQPYRLEDAVRPTRNAPFWLIDFAKLRFDGGPGKASKATPVESFELDGGFGFAEETAMLYHAETDYVVMQYNHYGPRAGSIEEYLSTVDLTQVNDFGLRLQLNPDAQARLDRKTIFTRLKIRVAPAKLSAAFRRNNMALVSSLEASSTLVAGDIVTVEVALERDGQHRSLNLGRHIRSLLRMANDEVEAVDSLVITGKDGVEDRLDAVDLISERLEHVIKQLPLDGGLRYPRDARYAALIRAFNGWRATGIIR